jgi:hypothetical protein
MAISPKGTCHSFIAALQAFGYAVSPSGLLKADVRSIGAHLRSLCNAEQLLALHDEMDKADDVFRNGRR